VCAGAYGDSLVDLSSSLCDWLHHPNLLRALHVEKEYRDHFIWPPHSLRKADNFMEEALLQSLELKNLARSDAEILPFVPPEPEEAQMWRERSGSVAQIKLHQMLFGPTFPAPSVSEFPSTAASFWYQMGSTFSMFSSWGYSFFKLARELRLGLLRHCAMFSALDLFRYAKPTKTHCMASHIWWWWWVSFVFA